jgi:hypothetical protein
LDFAWAFGLRLGLPGRFSFTAAATADVTFDFDFRVGFFIDLEVNFDLVAAGDFDVDLDVDLDVNFDIDLELDFNFADPKEVSAACLWWWNVMVMGGIHIKLCMYI